MLSTIYYHKVPFFDVDSYRIVWHGHYVKYFEMARCQLLSEIGCTYLDMEKGQCLFPIVKLNTKFIAPVIFGQDIAIQATLTEWHHRLAFDYLIYDVDSGVKLTRGSTIQVPVSMPEKISQFVCPDFLLASVESAMNVDKSTVTHDPI